MSQTDMLSELGDLAQKYHQAQGTIAKLQQQVETQEYTLKEQAQRIQQLEGNLGQAQAQLARVAQFEGQLEYFKAEMLNIMDERYKQPATIAPESAPSSLTQQQLDSHTQNLKELRREMDKMQRYDDQISLARTEATRLNKNVHELQADLDKLSKALDERVKPLGYIEDQRRAMARSLAELQAEVPDLHRKVDGYRSKLQLMEQKLPQFAKYEAGLDSLRNEIRRHREHIDFQAAERDRQLKNWTELAQSTEKRMKENEDVLEKYTQHYQLNKRALTSLQDFQERLQREQHRFGELQRLAENRQRAELEKVQADHEQRWQKQGLELQPQVGDILKNLDAVRERLDDLSKLQHQFENQMTMVLQIIEEDVEARAAAVNSWQERFETIAINSQE